VLKNFFGAKVLLFCLCSRRCFWFCMVFLALFARVLMVLSMLLKGTINVANRDVYGMLKSFAEKRFQKKKVTDP